MSRHRTARTAPHQPRDRRRKAPRLQRCALGKVRFPDHESAVEALHGARFSRLRSEELGMATRRQEQRAYRCDICRGWHLTSKSAVEAPRRMGESAVFAPRPHWAGSRRREWDRAA